jgi:uncharacterized protein
MGEIKFNENNYYKDKPFDACRSDDIETLQILIGNGADVNQTDKVGHTLLIIASCRKYYEIVKLLIDRGANINYIGPCGYNAVMIACERGHSEIANLLIENGADMHHVCYYDMGSALTFALRRGNLEIVAYYIDYEREHSNPDIPPPRKIKK